MIEKCDGVPDTGYIGLRDIHRSSWTDMEPLMSCISLSLCDRCVIPRWLSSRMSVY